MIQKLKNYFYHLPKAILANFIYGFPSRKLFVIGITGTKGKTSVAHQIHHLLKTNNKKSTLISTISAPGLHVTTPSSFALQKLIKQAVDSRKKYLILEVTSHALDQYRIWGIKFDLALFTQITRDHLYYHQTLGRYRQAKAKLIRQAKFCLFNSQDPSLKFLETFAKKYKCSYQIYQTQDQNFVKQNQAAVKAIAKKIGFNNQTILQAIKTFTGIPGRIELVYNQAFKVYIDFAHTSHSLEAVLKYLRPQTRGRLIAVFGCAGGRDHTRRKMGFVAGKLADFIIVTAEDPRTESAKKICQEIAQWAKKAGAKQIKNFLIIPDRQQAINHAISIAKPGDVIGLFGKGHEKSMCFGKIEQPWSEHEAFKKALKSTLK